MEMEKVRVYFIPNLKHHCKAGIFLEVLMETKKNTILFTLVYQDKQYPAKTRRDQYHTLMALIADHLSILGFEPCSGMGSCGTCMVKISEKHSSTERITLSCEVQISDELANTQITIAENNY